MRKILKTDSCRRAVARIALSRLPFAAAVTGWLAGWLDLGRYLRHDRDDVCITIIADNSVIIIIIAVCGRYWFVSYLGYGDLVSVMIIEIENQL